MVEETESTVFEDAESYKMSEPLSIKAIVLRQLQKCIDEGSKEMTLGGIQQRMIRGVVYELGVPNQVEIFINSVSMLRTLLTADMSRHNDTFKDSIQEYQDSIDTAMKEFKDRCAKYNEQMNKIDDPMIKATYQADYNKKMNWTQNVREEKILTVYKDNLLVLLCALLDKINYMDESRGNFNRKDEKTEDPSGDSGGLDNPKDKEEQKHDNSD